MVDVEGGLKWGTFSMVDLMSLDLDSATIDGGLEGDLMEDSVVDTAVDT